ncbi:MAG: hypothetical protein V1921_05700 [Candidatus Altiarchaeota archaeon]
MRKKHIILMAILAAALLAVLYYPRESKELRSLSLEYPQIVECKGYDDPYLKGNCFRQAAVDNNVSGLCMLSPNALGRSECLTKFALDNSDIMFCSQIDDPDYRDGCIYSVSIDTRNSTLCDSVQSNASRTRCLAKTIGNPDSCSGIENQEGRDWCMMKLAVETYTVELCSKVVTPSLRDACYFEYVQKNPLASASCKKVSDESLQMRCFNESTILACPIDKFKPKFGEPL